MLCVAYFLYLRREIPFFFQSDSTPIIRHHRVYTWNRYDKIAPLRGTVRAYNVYNDIPLGTSLNLICYLLGYFSMTRGIQHLVSKFSIFLC
jgi:hypothetical protein